MAATDQAVQITQIAAQAASDKLATDLRAFDVSERLVFTDVFLIATAANERQASAIVDGVEEALFKVDVKALRSEGQGEGEWVLVDFGDLILHVQQPDARELYSLERLWRDCPAIELDVETDADSKVG